MIEEIETTLRPADAPASIYGPDGRPQFFQDPAMDRFVSVLLNVASELWVQTERLANIEEALAQKGTITAAELRVIGASLETGTKRDAEAKAFLNRLLAPLREPTT